jgi:hypothetical protein
MTGRPFSPPQDGPAKRKSARATGPFGEGRKGRNLALPDPARSG